MQDVKRKTDLSVLDEIIEMCEEAMVRPFSKKKHAMKQEDVVDQEYGGEEEEKEEKPSFSDEDLEELEEEYKRKKGE